MDLKMLEGCLCMCLFLHDSLLQKKLFVSLTGYYKQNSACLWRLIYERSGSNEIIYGMWNKCFDFIGAVDTSYISAMLSSEFLGHSEIWLQHEASCGSFLTDFFPATQKSDLLYGLDIA